MERIYYYHKKIDHSIKISAESRNNEFCPFMPDGSLWEDYQVYDFFNRVDPTKKCTVVDIGAQIGLYTLYAKFLPLSTFYAFEPNPESFRLLNDNIKLNDITNVHSYQLAISDKIGLSTLNTSIHHMGLHTLGEKPLRFSDIKPITVETTTLDEFFYKNKISVDFIKIDTEGYEYYILKGGVKTIQTYKPIIQLEYNTTNMQQCGVALNALDELLTSIGYKFITQFGEEKIYGPM